MITYTATSPLPACATGSQCATGTSVLQKASVLQEASLSGLADLSYGVDMVKFWVEMDADKYDRLDPFWTSEWTPNTRSWVTKRRVHGLLF